MYPIGGLDRLLADAGSILDRYINRYSDPMALSVTYRLTVGRASVVQKILSIVYMCSLNLLKSKKN